MSTNKLPPMVASLDKRLSRMTTAQKNRFLRYRRLYILADQLALPVALGSVFSICAFPYWFVAAVGVALMLIVGVTFLFAARQVAQVFDAVCFPSPAEKEAANA